MFDLRSDETIVAVSTPPGTGGIGILRLSGPKARTIAAKIFHPAAVEEKKFPERLAVFGALYDREQEITLDEGFLCYFKAPRSYTRQDIVEISVHGSPAVLAEGVRLSVKAGARHALPGEFTLRAYLNGRIDMVQAEAIDDLIRAATPAQARLASRQVLGGLSVRMSALRTGLIELLADIEAGIEFPEESSGRDESGLGLRLNELASDVDGLVRSYEAGKALGEGLTLAIVGRANVGKSTLFNALLGHPRAIVAPQAGTTRDYLREKMSLGDAVLNLVDMAGLGPSSSAVEKEGIRRSGELAGRADGIIFLFDGSVKETSFDLALIAKFAGKKSILVFSKSDLGRKIDTGKFRRLAPHSPALSLSALTGHNLPALRTLLAKAFVPEFSAGEEIVAHLRQKVLLEEILGKIAAAMSFCRGGSQLELAAEEIRGAIPALERLTGAVRADDVIESIFSRFCVGK